MVHKRVRALQALLSLGVLVAAFLVAPGVAHAGGPELSASGNDIGKRWTICARDLSVRNAPGGKSIGTLYGPRDGASAQSFTIKSITPGGEWVHGRAWGHVNRDGYVQNGWFCRNNVPSAPAPNPTGTSAPVATSASQWPVPGSHPFPPQALPEAASALEKRFQPAIDYDRDSCYVTPAIGPDGSIARGLPLEGTSTEHCRKGMFLYPKATNIYSRPKCNNGWCAIMYAFYFQKDQAAGAGGHTHDWEHVVVWAKKYGDFYRAEHVATSAHGGYKVHSRAEMQWCSEEKPKVVYHRDDPFTHAMRPARAGERAENPSGRWQLPAIVSWNSMRYNLRVILTKANFGSAKLDLKDEAFGSNERFNAALNRAKPAVIRFKAFG